MSKRQELQVADNLSLPLEAVTQTFCVLAKRGVGKTYTASVMAEEMLKAGQQVVCIDPTGAWWGLRSGFPVVILGGEHADVPLEDSAGEVIARAVVEHRFPAVLDLSLFRKGQMIRFMVAFAETLYRLNREALHLFVDEADAVAPQARNYGGDENRMLGAMEDIVRRGRKRGIGCTLITQRPAVINKNVLTQCEVLVAMRLVHPKDIDAVEEWVNVHADPDTAKEMIDSLPSLPVGTAWFWSPGWGDIFRRVKVRKRETFDSSATPKPGESAKKPKDLAPIDLAALGDQIRSTVERARQDDPRELKRRIAELERQLRERPAEQVPVEVRVEVPVLNNGQLDSLRTSVESLDQTGAVLVELAHNLREAMGRAARQPSPPQRPPARVAPPAPTRPRQPAPATGEDSVGRGGLRRILVALAQRPGLTNRQIGLRARLSSQSGTFSTYLGRARSAGWLRDEDDRRFITEAGLAALGDYEPLPEGRALLDYWLSALGNGGASRMLRALAEAYPRALTNAELGEAADISHASGTFSTYLGRLRGLELVQGRGELRASDELFGG